MLISVNEAGQIFWSIRERTVELELILRFIFIGVVHWVLAGLLLQDLAYRRRVVGGRKWFWAVIIIFIACLGSLVYLLFHPQILSREDGENGRRHGR